MRILELIEKKKKKQALTKEEIEYFIKGYLNDEIKDYQASALLMAICLNDMTDEETFNLTKAMLDSGNTIDLSNIKGIKVDKHSTGGVGDKTSIILAPIVASTGVKMAKMSGRGLGHTGGTIDKLEAIKGFQTSLTEEEFVNEVNNIGLAITGQTGNIAPADKKLYALRDVTGTVNSIPLIASSIMSKKLASSADKIVIDLKVGNGALASNIKDARRLGNLMVNIGKSAGKEVVCFLTNMNEPLGNNIGNGLEVLEAIDVLKGNGPKDLKKLILELSSTLVMMGKNITKEEALKEVKENIKNKKAYQKFLEFVKAQHGDINTIAISNKIFSLKTNKSGYIQSIDTLKLGEIVRSLGAGRYSKEDTIDYGVGIILNKKVGDFILENEELAKIYWNEKDASLSEILSCFKIDSKFKKKNKLIYEIIK